ncbi:GNAT family N-acetyltransferase [Cardinium endosymbiont of Nabis limbatus]|uniref:GNAT family N-acetyltransferase n=1 Tax=Cardinium endosymbiont of Nabis limbatus TaxID=3066217 RepID=UPI003AF36C02
MHPIKNLSRVPKLVALSKDLRIKQLDQSDAEALFLLTEQNRSYLKRWLPWFNTCMNLNDTLNFIANANDEADKNSRLVFGIFFKEKISGMISFNTIDVSSGQAEIGYWIGEALQRLGLITCACAKLVDIGFTQLGLKLIAIRCGIENTKSQNVPMRLGFKKSDTILEKENVHGIYIDLLLYTIQRDQWHNR